MFICSRILLYTVCFLLCFSPLFLAAPTSSASLSATSSSPTSLFTNSTSVAPTSSSLSHRRTQTPTSFRSTTTRTKGPHIPPKLGTHLPSRPTPVPVPEPFEEGDIPPPPPRDRRTGPTKQKPVAIFFEVFGGLAALALVVCITRCLYSYRRTPRRDRIADVVARHRLQREMEEMQQAERLRRPVSFVEPPPPYLPRPPSYEGLGNQTALLSRTHHSSDSASTTSSTSHGRSDSDDSIYLSHPVAQSSLVQAQSNHG